MLCARTREQAHGRSEAILAARPADLPDHVFVRRRLYGDPALMPGMIKKTQVPPPGTAVWKCLWGPAQNDDDANLAFVAGYYPDPNAAPESIFVTIRGTDVDIDDIWGILKQIWEDLDAGETQAMP